MFCALEKVLRSEVVMYLYSDALSSHISNLSDVSVAPAVSWLSELAGSTPTVLPLAVSGEFAVTDADPIGDTLRSLVTITPVELSISAFTSLVDTVGVPEIFRSPVVSTVSVDSFSAVELPAPSSTICSEEEALELDIFSNSENVSLILLPLRLPMVLLLKQRY